MPTFDGFLGEVETLEGKRIKIRAMHDIFLAYAFHNGIGSDIFAEIINAFLHEYNCKTTGGKIDLLPNSGLIIETQYSYFLDTNKERRQDFRTIYHENQQALHVEFQIRATEKVPVSMRAGYYLALSIVDFAKTTDKAVTHLWLLGESMPDIIPEGTCEMYCLIGEFCKKRFPTQHSLLFMDLPKIAKNSKYPLAKEVAQFLLGQTDVIPSERGISEFFFNRFENFAADKEVKTVILTWDKTRAEAEAEGMAAGMEKARIEMAKNMALIGMSMEQIAAVTSLSVSEIESLLRYEETTG